MLVMQASSQKNRPPRDSQRAQETFKDLIHSQPKLVVAFGVGVVVAVVFIIIILAVVFTR
jgi:hypothetical protein